MLVFITLLVGTAELFCKGMNNGICSYLYKKALQSILNVSLSLGTNERAERLRTVVSQIRSFDHPCRLPDWHIRYRVPVDSLRVSTILNESWYLVCNIIILLNNILM